MLRGRMSTAWDGTNGGLATSLQENEEEPVCQHAAGVRERARRRWPEGENDGGEKSAVPEPDRAFARHAGPADSADAAVGAATWLWDQRGHPQSFRRNSAGGYRLALSGAAPVGKTEMD